MSSHCKHEPTQMVLVDWPWVWPEPKLVLDFNNWWVGPEVCSEGRCEWDSCPVCGAWCAGMGPVNCPCVKWEGVPAAQRPKQHVPTKG